MSDYPPTRYPNGVGDSSADGAFQSYLQPRPTRYATWFNDFFGYTASDWVVTETDAGSTETIVAAGEGGQLAITNVSAGATDAASLQWAGGSGAVATQFTWDSTLDLFLEARFKLSDATNAACLVGLASTDTSPVASLPTNGIFFYKAGGAATLIASVRKAGASTSVTLGSMVADTFVNVALVYTASDGTWRAFLNNTMIGSFSTASVSPTAALAPTIGLLNASAVAHVLTTDRLVVSKQR